jgi:hypothetical protein
MDNRLSQLSDDISAHSSSSVEQMVEKIRAIDFKCSNKVSAVQNKLTLNQNYMDSVVDHLTKQVKDLT